MTRRKDMVRSESGVISHTSAAWAPEEFWGEVSKDRKTESRIPRRMALVLLLILVVLVIRELTI